VKLLQDYMTLFLETYRKYLCITPDDIPILKLILGAAAAQHLGPRAELLWLVLVGPPASSKTTMLNPFLTCKEYVISRDDCTGNAMISASDPEGLRARARAEGKEDEAYDPSLIRVLDGKLFIVKDLTILLNRKDEADNFWGHLRAAYDGRLEKHSGTVGFQGQEKIRFGFIGATTDGSIEGSLVRMSKLGERAVYLRVQQETTSTEQDWTMGLNMLSNRNTQHVREQELADKVHFIYKRCIKQVKRAGMSEPRHHNPIIVRKVVDLASALAKLRTSPREDSQLPHERNARLVKQFGTLCDSVAICSGRRKWTDDEVALCRKVVRSSLPSKIRFLFDYVATCSFFPDKTARPTAPTASRVIGSWRRSFAENQLRQWVSVGLLTADSNGRYSVKPDVLERYVELGIILKPKVVGSKPAVVKFRRNK